LQACAKTSIGSHFPALKTRYPFLSFVRVRHLLLAANGSLEWFCIIAGDGGADGGERLGGLPVRIRVCVSLPVQLVHLDAILLELARPQRQV
jgi:hypothetical protein